MKKVMIAMSGGVDSSVAAFLLKKQGYDVFAVYMKNWDCDPKEYADVGSVCEKIDIPYYTISFKEEYRDKVFDKFLNYLDLGFNINPDVLCNKYIKFDELFNMAMKLGADFLATGHYCSIKNGQLSQPLDLSKDQSYFLYDVDSTVLDRVLFPLSNLLKSQVRKIAEDNGLITFDKKDSTGICFIGNKNFKDFISKYRTSNTGNIIYNNKIIGKHNGLHYYVIGQRKGLGLSNGPYVVVNKDIKDNSLIVDKIDSSSVFFSEVDIFDKNSNYNGDCYLRFSNLGTLHKGEVFNDKIILKKRIKKVALGQSVVFYDEKGRVLGGALIKGY